MKGFLDPKNPVVDTKIVSLCGLEAKILPKIDISVHRWRPFCFLALKKFPQGCQAGTRLILDLDSLEMMKQQKNFIIAKKHAFVKCGHLASGLVIVSCT